jgi:hypothetical protein
VVDEFFSGLPPLLRRSSRHLTVFFYADCRHMQPAQRILAGRAVSHCVKASIRRLAISSVPSVFSRRDLIDEIERLGIITAEVRAKMIARTIFLLNGR